MQIVTQIEAGRATAPPLRPERAAARSAGLREILVRRPARLWRRLVRPRLAPWTGAGLMLTYRCNAACADCYVNSGPRRRAALPLEDLREILKDLRRLGCTGRSLHFGGGEPFFDFDHLIACFEAAAAEGMVPLGKLETNAFWCKSDRLVRERLTRIQHFGIDELLVSCDEFHQEFVPIDRVRRAVRIGREIFGEDRVRVSSRRFFANPIDVRSLTEKEKAEVFGGAVARHPWRMVGRAARTLAPLAERHPPESFAGERCAGKILRSGSIHIDPHGNVFPSTCAGLVLGNTRAEPLTDLWSGFDLRRRPVTGALVEGGPVALLAQAARHGYRAPEAGFASKCHLCFELRRFFHERGLHPDEVGPAEIYASQEG